MARSSTILGQFYKGVVVCHLVLGASSRGEREKEQKGTRTLTRLKISITDPDATFKGAISMLCFAAVRASMSAFKAAVVVEGASTPERMLSIVQGSMVMGGK